MRHIVVDLHIMNFIACFIGVNGMQRLETYSLTGDTLALESVAKKTHCPIYLGRRIILWHN